MILHKIGISGCKTELITNAIVRKTSPSVTYNQRLERQMTKQIEFTKHNFNNILVPKVYNTGYIDGLFYFDMQYIDGKLFNEEFYRVSKPELDVYVKTFLEYLDHSKSNVTLFSESDVKSLLREKLQSLQKSSQYNLLIEFVLEQIEKTKIDTLPHNICHGDLTFSNILFSGGQLCFLDLLDSYIESYVIDIIKLKQDAYYKWYLNILPVNQAYVARTHQIFDYMWKRISEHYVDVVHSELFAILDVTNFLRIEPYLTIPSQHKLLFRTIQDTKLYEDFNRTHDGKVYTISQS